MKRFLSTLLVLGFIGIAAFGASFFDMSKTVSGGCVATTVNGTACQPGFAGRANHHISAFQSLLAAAVPPGVSWFSWLVFLFIGAVGMPFFYKSLLLLVPDILLRRRREHLSYNFLGQKKFVSWLCLFELSPALSRRPR